MGLNLDTLRTANLERLPRFKNGKGNPAHTSPDGSDWSLAEWSNAVLGELGEAANIIKKITRGDYALEDVRGELGKEFADVLIYLDILAYQAGIDLGNATIEKWNETCRKVGVPMVLNWDDWHFTESGQRQLADWHNHGIQAWRGLQTKITTE